jgi:CheY-like chemotaxis protein
VTGMGPTARTVLVVDDAPELVTFLELLLRDAGYTVRTAANLTELDKALAQSRPDLVITDALVAGAAPFAVLDRLAADPTTRTLPVLVCTGAVHELHAHSARLRAAHIGVLLKPFAIDVLLHCVASLLTPGTALPDQTWHPTGH